MAKTVFWAWQSDHDGRTGRHLIKSAIEEALKVIGTEALFDERPEIDHDTKDVMGLAAIADEIFKKISRASAFVGDLTPIVSKTQKGKKRKWLANPNVLIELGYAKNALGTGPLILVWNTARRGTKPEDLPFDLAHRRAPIGYCAPLGCTGAELAAARTALAKELRAPLIAILSENPQPAGKLEWTREAGRLPSMWMDYPSLLSITHNGRTEDWRIDNQTKAWLRTKPSTWPKDKTASALPNLPTLGEATLPMAGRIQGAAFHWSGNREEHYARTGSAWFLSDGEIWSYDSSALIPGKDGPRIPALELLGRWLSCLRWFQDRTVEAGGKGPFLVQCGIGPMTSVKWAGDDGQATLSADPWIVRDFVTASHVQTITEMEAFYRALCDSFGHSRVTTDGFRQFALPRLIN